jgi:hypothetical protein
MTPRHYTTALLLLATTSGCGSTDVSEDLGFTIGTGAMELIPGEAATYARYFRTPNDREVAVKEWAARLPAHTQMMVFLTGADVQPPGTLTTADCHIEVGSDATVAFIAYQPDSRFQFPGDDGTGTPVGQIIPPGQAGFLRISILNPTSDTIRVEGELTAAPYENNTAVTRADPLVAYNSTILIPGPSEKSEIRTCNTPPDVSFVALSVFSHKQSVQTSIKDGESVVFLGSDFANPGVATFPAPFYQFITGKLSYQCDFVNSTNTTILTGDNPETGEMCMAVTYFFPSRGPRYCLGNLLVQAVRQPDGLPSLAVRSQEVQAAGHQRGR